MQANILARIRSIAAGFLTDNCLIEREAIDVGAYGDTVRTWEIVASDVPCRVIVARRSDLNADGVSLGRETLDETYRLVLPQDVSLDVDYRVTVSSDTYSVVRIETALSDGVFTQAILRRKR